MRNKTLEDRNMEKLGKKLMYRNDLVWDVISPKEKEEVFAYGEVYKEFLNRAKTEREAVAAIKEAALKKGFAEDINPGSFNPIIKVIQGKSIALALPGKRAIEEGIRLIVSHIDAPRLDLKQKPIYEDVDLTFLKTHYYGGIKKYQWPARPLAIHGRIVKADGSLLDIAIGEKESDPVFSILDLLPHLSRKVQYDKKVSEAIEGEKLNLIAGSLPLGTGKVKERFKLSLLHHLYEAYGLVEEDLVSAELEVVPAEKARDVGWDRSLVGAYGQDDRSSAFAGLKALLDLKKNEKTAVILFVDKEEIGSSGATGAQSKFIESFIGDLMINMGQEPSTRKVNELLGRSCALSADVNSALDPDYQEVHEKRNAARMGYGVCLAKFMGHGGKVGANDANAEYVGWLRRLFNKKKVVWQTGEIGKVDEGGGGTVAKFLAVYGMEIIDCGPPVLSMHSPFEIAHKGDLYMTYRGFKAFLESPAA
ncbi:MAG: aminopeptidase [Pseudomonadota bacterium]